MFDDAADVGVLSAGTQVGNYRIERALAEGGMATVYEANHLVLPRRAALKVMHRHLLGKWGARERLLQEARVLDAFDHPGLVRLHDAGVLDDSRPWLAMELLEGATLAELISVHHTLEVIEVCDLLAKVASALMAAHRIGVVHRDLKPENIVIVRRDRELRPTIVDWGIARVAGAGELRITRADMTPGTPLYMSPEQARGKPLDGRSDIYALGVIAFEALTGRLPFEGDSAMDVVVQHLTTPPPLVSSSRPDLPEAVDDLVDAMLAKEPDDRPWLTEIIDQLTAIQEIEMIPIHFEIEIEAELPCDLSRGRAIRSASQSPSLTSFPSPPSGSPGPLRAASGSSSLSRSLRGARRP
jgi:serine/threonine-protein kinase